MKISLVIPMYNEKSIIADAITTFQTFMCKNYDDWELIFVSDGSTDGCNTDVEFASADDPRVRLVAYPENAGKGCAVRTGMLASTGDIAVFTDCDNAYGTDAVYRIVQALDNAPDADIVVGSRNLSADGYENYTFIRKLASKTYIKVINGFMGFHITDSQSGLKAFRGDAAKKIFRNCRINRWAFDIEVLLIADKLGMKINELPVKIVNHRESKVRVFSDSLKMLRDIAKLKKEIKTRELV